MNIETLRKYCLSKKAATESFPFDEHTLVFKVMGKIFAMVPLEKWEAGAATVTLKCDPEYTGKLREQYESIYAGPYVSNTHWNTIDVYKGEFSMPFVLELIDHSYDRVVAGLPKKLKRQLE